MKRRDLVAELEKAGCHLLRHGSCHDIYRKPADPSRFPATGEINEILAKKILKDLTMKPK